MCKRRGTHPRGNTDDLEYLASTCHAKSKWEREWSLENASAIIFDLPGMYVAVSRKLQVADSQKSLLSRPVKLNTKHDTHWSLHCLQVLQQTDQCAAGNLP